MFQNQPDAAERIRMHANVLACIQTGFDWVCTRPDSQKPCEALEKNCQEPRKKDGTICREALLNACDHDMSNIALKVPHLPCADFIWGTQQWKKFQTIPQVRLIPKINFFLLLLLFYLFWICILIFSLLLIILIWIISCFIWTFLRQQIFLTYGVITKWLKKFVS